MCACGGGGLNAASAIFSPHPLECFYIKSNVNDCSTLQLWQCSSFFFLEVVFVFAGLLGFFSSFLHCGKSAFFFNYEV